MVASYCRAFVSGISWIHNSHSENGDISFPSMACPRRRRHQCPSSWAEKSLNVPIRQRLHFQRTALLGSFEVKSTVMTSWVETRREGVWSRTLREQRKAVREIAGAHMRLGGRLLFCAPFELQASGWCGNKNAPLLFGVVRSGKEDLFIVWSLASWTTLLLINDGAQIVRVNSFLAVTISRWRCVNDVLSIWTCLECGFHLPAFWIMNSIVKNEPAFWKLSKAVERAWVAFVASHAWSWCHVNISVVC